MIQRAEDSIYQLRLESAALELQETEAPPIKPRTKSSPRRAAEVRSKRIRRPVQKPATNDAVEKQIEAYFESKFDQNPKIKVSEPHPPPQMHPFAPQSKRKAKIKAGTIHSTATVSKVHGFLGQHNMEEMVQRTGYDRDEICTLWVRFKALCSLAKTPYGIDKETLYRGVPLLSVEDSMFVDRVFDILDLDKSGIIEWEEFVEAMSSLERGCLLRRLQFLFRVYDLNGDGQISREELSQFFIASLLVIPTQDIRDVSENFVERIFDQVQGSGATTRTISLSQAQEYVQKQSLEDIYSLFGRSMVVSRY